MKIVPLIVILFLNELIIAQTPTISWQKCYGGTNYDEIEFETGNGVTLCKDGGYIVAGYTYSNDGDVNGNHGGNCSPLPCTDAWVIKIDSLGLLQWQRTIGGTANDAALSIIQTSDSGFIIGGTTFSNNGDVVGNHGSSDCWIIKLSTSGMLLWQKCYGGTSSEGFTSIYETIDHGLIATGVTSSNDSDVVGNHGYSDFWVVKTDSIGNLLWQKCLGGSGEDRAWSVQQTNDLGYLIGGYTSSIDGDVSNSHGDKDYWLIKLDSTAHMQLQWCLGGSNRDECYSARQTFDGGYILNGYSDSKDGDVTINHDSLNSEMWVYKLGGTIQWQKVFGGTRYDRGNCVRQLRDSSYIITGTAGSFDGDVTGLHGSAPISPDDIWVVKLDMYGNLQWQKCLGGYGTEYSGNIEETSDGGFIVAGTTESNSGDVSGNHGYSDFWIVKLSPPGMDITEPDPSIGDLTIFLDDIEQNIRLRFVSMYSQNISVSLYDIVGRKIISQTIQVSKGINYTQVRIPSITAGIYLVEIFTSSGSQVVKLRLSR